MNELQNGDVIIYYLFNLDDECPVRYFNRVVNNVIIINNNCDERDVVDIPTYIING